MLHYEKIATNLIILYCKKGMIKLKFSNINVFEDITDDELLTKVCKKNKINQS